MIADAATWTLGPIALATKHGKEHQFGPPLRDITGAALVVAAVDTDQLGTFTGETPRPAGPVETARRKATWAIEHSGEQIGLASEGSYGPHPEAGFVPVGVELAVLIAPTHGIEVVERLVCLDTNFAHVDVRSPDVLDAFITTAGFPAHALVVSCSTSGPFVKGIRDRGRLDVAVHTALETTGRAIVQTDMRAHLNPTRQLALGRLGQQLAERLARTCPACGAPGWGVVEHIAGQLCEWCDRPTAGVAGERSGCARATCGLEHVEARTGWASAGQCAHCNP